MKKVGTIPLLRQRVEGAWIFCVGLALPLSTSTGTARAMMEAGVPLWFVAVIFMVCGVILMAFRVRAFTYFVVIQCLLVYSLTSLYFLSRGGSGITPIALALYPFIYANAMVSAWERLLHEQSANNR